MSWERYYEKNKGRPLRPFYSRAIQLLKPTAKRAVDLGCGIGIEVFDMLQRGFEVHALDQEPKSIGIITQHASANLEKLHTHLSSLENWTVWPMVDFLFAYHSFPFCAQQSFDSVVHKALSSVACGGIFAASFFGLEDDWAKEGKAIGISFDDVKKRFHDYEILYFEEIKKTGSTALQGDKMWNVIEVIARRK